MKQYSLIVVAIFFSVSAFAQKVYDFNSNCKTAYAEIIKLKLATGEELIAKERLQNPNNLIPDLLDGYIDFFNLFFNLKSILFLFFFRNWPGFEN